MISRMLDSVFQGVRTFLTASCLLVFGVTAAWSQPTGQLSGVVRDTMGGVLPGVEVSVTSVSAITPRTSLTDWQGRYEVDALPPGRYTVEASLGGFQPKASDVDIDRGRATLDLVLFVSTVLEMHAMSAQVAFQARDYNAALEHARQATVIDPEFWIGHIELANAHLQLGRTDLALQALTKVRHPGTGTLAFRGYLFAKQGQASEARDVLGALEAVARDTYVPPSRVALVYAGLGEREAVLDWLEKAYAARDVNLIFLPVDPKWDPYRTDSRFEALLARCGFTRND